MPLLNPTHIDCHTIVSKVALPMMEDVDRSFNVGSLVETLAGKHYTDITFARGGHWAQPVLDKLKEDLEPQGYKAYALGEHREIIRVLHPRPNWMIIIGYQGNRRGYINVPEEEARRRWLASENEGAPPDCLKTEVDEPVELIRFHDEINIY